MNTPNPSLPPELQALSYLYLLFLDRGGYQLRGVRGWALNADVESSTDRRLHDVLPRLARRGLVDREDVRHPRRVRPTWIYRITSAGVEWLCRTNRISLRDVDEPWPADPALPRPVYVPGPCQLVLEELRRLADDPAAPTPFPGEPGWLSAHELDARLPETFGDQELRWLQVGGLIEKRHVLPPGRKLKREVYYHVTQEGRLVRPLVWREPTSLPSPRMEAATAEN